MSRSPRNNPRKPSGDELVRKMGPRGFLARELLAEIPGLMRELAAR